MGKMITNKLILGGYPILEKAMHAMVIHEFPMEKNIQALTMNNPPQDQLRIDFSALLLRVQGKGAGHAICMSSATELWLF